ncbi:MAG TPA: hypothetical protein VL918_08300 [Sphingobium sp.]|nr:hypothetical protein [Sphingobium sp.]
MATKRRTILALAFFGSFLTVGLPYWQIQYSQVSLPHAVWGLPLIVVVVLAALPRLMSAAGFWRTTLVVGASVPAAVFARVVYDTLSDPTSHNLWPFEIVLAAGPGFAAAFAGAISGKLLAWATIPAGRRDSRPDQ